MAKEKKESYSQRERRLSRRRESDALHAVLAAVDALVDNYEKDAIRRVFRHAAAVCDVAPNDGVTI